MSASTHFLKEICKNPDDDDIRLIYADWLDDHGQEPRAEFIRVRIELARMQGDDPRRPKLARRETELLFEYENEWVKEFEDLGDVHLSRGFISGADCSRPYVFPEIGKQPFTNNPITYVILDAYENQLTAAFRYRHFSRVRELRVCHPTPNSISVMFESSRTANIEGLYLSGLNPIRQAWQHFFRPIVQLPPLRQIKRLGFDHKRLNRDAISDLEDSGILARLEGLLFFSSTLHDAFARRIAESSSVSELRELRLDGSDLLTDSGVKALANSPHLHSLERLSLFTTNKLTSSGLEEIARSPYLQNLTDLDVRQTQVTRAGVNSLIKSTNLPRLSRILVSGTPASRAFKDLRDFHQAFPPREHHPGVIWVAERRNRG